MKELCESIFYDRKAICFCNLFQRIVDNCFCCLPVHSYLYLFLGVDRQMAEHIAHLFIRDPISLFKEKLFQDDENDTDHFEVCLLATVCFDAVRHVYKIFRLIMIIMILAAIEKMAYVR